MIESIEITNFQAHSILKLDLDERVTTIVGPSDVGKSSTIRALRWACLNIPVSSLIRDGSKEARAEVTADGHSVLRTRGSENSYHLDGSEYKAFRTSVPDSIADLLNLADINFQGQHDPVYWFSQSSGEVSRQLNAIVNLKIIDASLAEMTRKFNAAKVKASVAEESLDGSVKERDALVWVEECDDSLAVVEAKEIEGDKLRTDVATTSQVLSWVIGAEDAAVKAKQRATDAASVASVAVLAGRHQSSRQVVSGAILGAVTARDKAAQEVPDLARLSELFDVVEEQKRAARVEELDEALGTAESADFQANVCVPSMFRLRALFDAAKELGQSRQELEDEFDDVDDLKGRTDEAHRLRDQGRAMLNKQMDGICPLCGGEMG